MRRLSSVFALACALIAGCAGTVQERRQAAAQVAAQAGWQGMEIEAGEFVLAAFAPPELARADTLTVYIEGDGAAWVDAGTPSFDPTPKDPVALRLAIGDPRRLAVYLARPCQYVQGPGRRHCAAQYWTSRRFAPEVIDASGRAIDQLKARYGATNLELVGYSGGGAVAALLAGRRADVARLVTVAGNLDPQFWAADLGLSPLPGSLNPADAWRPLSAVPQRHYVGGQDRVMPERVARSYASRFPTGRRPEIVVVPGFDHRCCWERAWPALLEDRNPAARR